MSEGNQIAAAAASRHGVRVGMPADLCVRAIVSAIDAIARVEFLSYSVFPSLEARLRRTPPAAAARQEALVHDRSGWRLFEQTRADLDVHRLEALVAALGPDVALGMTSRVALADGTLRHLLMMDFRCDVGPHAQDAVVDALRVMGHGHGVLLDSGASYHFYGLELVDDDGWRRFMGQALLVAPLVDVRYIAHRLIDGFSVLRVTATTSKPTVPMVVAVW